MTQIKTPQSGKTAIAVTLIDHMGNDLSVVNAARVSFGKSSSMDEDNMGVWHLKQGDTKLIKYLAKHNHISPFGHCFVSFHIKAPIFVARQLVKHKFLRWNEISRRYVDDEPEFYVPDVWRGKSADKKQGSSSEVIDIIDYDGTNGKNGFSDPYSTLTEIALETYQDLLEKGVAPEQARMVLPQSSITEWYWSGSTDAFASMCRLRCASDTQYESRIVADQISDVMRDLFPVSWDALLKAGEE